MDDFESYAKRCRAAGYSDEDTRNTWELMESIGKILDDKDVDPFKAPELVQPQKVRLARLFIDRSRQITKEGDAAISAYLRTQGVASEVVSRIAEGAQWRWWHEEKKKAKPA